MRRESAALPGILRPWLAAAACLALAACGSVNPDDPNRVTAKPGLGGKLLLGDMNPEPLTEPVDASLKRVCPPVDILEGTASYRVFDTPGSTDPFTLRYQASIAETARECSPLGVEAGIKVGVVGRVALGPKGSPGVVRIPLRIAVVDETSKPLYSQSHTVEVTIPPGQGSASFTRIEQDIVVPIPANRFAGWRILVGYDPVASAGGGRRRG